MFSASLCSPRLYHRPRDRTPKPSVAANRVKTVFRYGAIAGCRIQTYASLARGMDEARQLIADHEQQGRSFPAGLVILAEELDGGKGRFRRAWHAPAGGIWLTMVFVNNLLPEISRLLPLAAGVACCETVQQFGVPARVKWVNDVHVQGRKVAAYPHGNPVWQPLR